MSKQRDTWGKPNMAERFIYHTKIGRLYARCGWDEFDVVRHAALVGSIALGLAIAALITSVLS